MSIGYKNISPEFSTTLYDKGIVPVVRIGVFQHFSPVGSIAGSFNGSEFYVVRTLQVAGETVETFGDNQTEVGKSDGGWVEKTYPIEKIKTSFHYTWDEEDKYQAAIMNTFGGVVLNPLQAKWHAVASNISFTAAKTFWQGNPHIGVSGLITNPLTGQQPALDWLNATTMEIYESIKNAVMSITNNTRFIDKEARVVVFIPTVLSEVLGDFLLISSPSSVFAPMRLEEAIRSLEGVKDVVLENPTLMTSKGDTLKIVVTSVDPDHAGVGVDAITIADPYKILKENQHLLDANSALEQMGLKSMEDKSIEDFNKSLLIAPLNRGLLLDNDVQGWVLNAYLPFAGGIVKQPGYTYTIDTQIVSTLSSRASGAEMQSLASEIQNKRKNNSQAKQSQQVTAEVC